MTLADIPLDILKLLIQQAVRVRKGEIILYEGRPFTLGDLCNEWQRRKQPIRGDKDKP